VLTFYRLWLGVTAGLLIARVMGTSGCHLLNADTRWRTILVVVLIVTAASVLNECGWTDR